MNIQVVAFYPTERDDEKGFLRGTLHIYLIDLGLHLRGIFIYKKDNFFSIRIPCFKARDKEGVYYPLISQDDPEKQKEFVNLVREKAKTYIETYLKDPCKQQKKTVTVKNDKKNFENATAKTTLKDKIWVDPPKRQLRGKSGIR